jgi:signal transduction histidine kinase
VVRVVREDDLSVVDEDDATSQRPSYGPLVQDLSARIRANAVEAPVLVFAAGSVVEALVSDGVRDRAAVAVLGLCWSLPWLAWRRNPLVAPLVATAALLVLGLIDGHDTTHLSLPFLAALLSAVAFGHLADRRLRVAGLCALVGTAAAVDFQSSNSAPDFLWAVLILSLAWFGGVALGARIAQTRELRKRIEIENERLAAAVEHAASDERTRIARELHDVVAHSVSVMVVQASGARRLLQPDQEREREALLAVERTGREALTEMRRMLGLMRSEAEPAARTPQPGLQHLDRLVAQIEEAGLPVTLHVEGNRPDLPAGLDLSAYRIVQEGLTNALKHARGSQTDVLVRYGDERVELEIVDNGPGAVNGSAADGPGLVGLRERVAVYGGTLEAGPRDGGGFVLRAELPVEARR